MPELARFVGITIKMYFGDTDHHQAPHIHAEYQGFAASIGIPGGEVLGGGLPSKQLKRVRTWVKRHEQALLDRWGCACRYEPFRQIEE